MGLMSSYQQTSEINLVLEVYDEGSVCGENELFNFKLSKDIIIWLQADHNSTQKRILRRHVTQLAHAEGSFRYKLSVVTSKRQSDRQLVESTR